jgi:hypothetical protein
MDRFAEGINQMSNPFSLFTQRMTDVFVDLYDNSLVGSPSVPEKACMNIQ